MYDVIIRGGSIIDGTGAEPFLADVAVKDGAIAALGEVSGEAKTEIDATGLTVTPGFVDIHTHLDAQIGWDPQLTPISWHGITTALLGNCGVTFAPCKPSDRELLAGMMETVEDIPRDAILGGLPWDWESYAQYLDSLEKLEPTINVAGLVGHCAVRFYVMGERAVTEEASEEELSRMAEVVGESVAGGAVGFSTSRFRAHFLPDGRLVPGTFAPHEELVRIAEAIKAHGGGLMQNVLNLPGDLEGEFELLRKQAQASGDRVLFSVGVGPRDGSGARMAQTIAELGAEGLDINAICIPRGSGFVVGLQHLLPWRSAAWGRLAKLDLAGRIALLEDESAVAELIQEAKDKPMRFPATQVFWLGDGDSPRYTQGPDESLQALADAAGEHPAETFLRLSRQSQGKALFTLRMFNQSVKACADLISSERCLPGLGDAGAHVSQIMDSGWTSFVLAHWVRETGLFTPSEAVRRMTSAPARILGLPDRGTLEVGKRADINVIDLNAVAERFPEIVHDLPGGAPRFIQKARGYRATLCNGQLVLENDEHTGARAGKVLRNTGATGVI
ncbi:MAG: amidohydrolase family protein [Myxococcales bacterium]|nr:amidohydrolase family protein [Myxococcales bacterium]